jgi:hypothetical protein
MNEEMCTANHDLDQVSKLRFKRDFVGIFFYVKLYANLK